jgi:hypothetical protein
MDSFEKGFADVERAADGTARAADSLLKAAKQLRRAAQDGDIAAVRRTCERLPGSLEAIRQEVANAQSAWPFASEAEETYLRDAYRAELLEQAEIEQLAFSEVDGRILAFPSIVRVQPADRSLKIDRKRVAAIRPSRIVRLLKSAQAKKSSFSSERFLATLYAAYELVRKDKAGTREVSLQRIYDALTIHPSVRSEYGMGDFARDLYLLDQSGLRETRSGVRFGLSAATSTKGSKHIELVAPSGETKLYSIIWFE